MENFVLSLLSMLVGVVATIFAARHYYQRSVQKELTPFIQFQSNVLAYMNKDVKSDLHIEYKGLKIDNLQQIQLLVANTGERAIRDLIKPLTLDFPDDVQVLEGNLLHIHPEGREVSFDIIKSGQGVEFAFPLLNRDDFFIFKLLVKGTPGFNDLKFSIVGDDLPPALEARYLSHNQLVTEGKPKSSFEFGLLLFGIGCLLVSLSVFTLAYYFRPESIPTFEVETFLWINSIPYAAITRGVGYGLAGVILVLGILGCSSAIFDSFELPKRGRRFFRVPQKFRSVSWDGDDLEPRKVMLTSDGRSITVAPNGRVLDSLPLP